MTVHVNKRGRRIVLTSQVPLSGLPTAVPGAYLTTSGYWTVPLSLESCKLLREKYGDSLQVGTELKRWARGVVQNRKYMSRLAAADDAKLDYLPYAAPRLYKAMRKRRYQLVGARFIADSTAVLEADDPGLGKTLIAMGGIIEARVPGPYLVIVTPKVATDLVWRRSILKWLPKDHKPVTLGDFRYQRESKLRLTRYTDKTWLIVHPEIVMAQAYWICKQCGRQTVETNRKQHKLSCGHRKVPNTRKIKVPGYPKIFDVEWGAIIIDESHDSLIKRARVPTQRRRGIDMLRLRSDGMKIAMSGTPWDSIPHQLWGTLNWLDPITYKGFHRWAELYWAKGGYTGFEIGEFRREREKMLWDSLSDIAIRRTKEEVAPDLPPKIEVGYPLEPSNPDSLMGIWLPMEGDQERAYREIEALSIAELDSGRLDAITALAELTRLRQMASAYGDIKHKKVWVSCQDDDLMVCRPCQRNGRHRENRYDYIPKLPSNKFTWARNSLEEWGYPHNPSSKVIFVSWYTGILELFRIEFEKYFRTRKDRPLCTAINGRITSIEERMRRIDRFNERGNEQIMMLNLRAGGSAITLDRGERMIFISHSSRPDREKQAEDRIHRVSNPRQCMYYHLYSLDTVDVGTALLNDELIRHTHRLLDGRRGVAHVRNIIDLSHNPFAGS